MAMFFGSAPISAGEVSSGVRQKSRFVENRERTADQWKMSICLSSLLSEQQIKTLTREFTEWQGRREVRTGQPA